jgi:hypothetical protein
MQPQQNPTENTMIMLLKKILLKAIYTQFANADQV